VNFCKFTNETRNGLEDSSAHSGLKFLAAVNGACAGGGYELALACDEIILVDDRSSAVSLPEVPLLGVLPGTGGLTRVTDKRHVRHDLADIFCTTTEGVRGQKAKDWRLVDDIAKPRSLPPRCRSARCSWPPERPPGRRQGRALTPLQRTRRSRRAALPPRHGRDRPRQAHRHLHREGAHRRAAADIAGIEAAGAAWYPLAMARELDDAILSMRTNELDIGTWLIKTEGDAAAVLAMDATLLAHQGHWLVRETIGLLRRTFSRLDVSQPQPVRADRAGLVLRRQLLELALACDRSYMLALPDDAGQGAEDHRRRRQLRPLPDGHRPEPPAAPLLRRAAGAGRRARQASASRWTPTPPSRSACVTSNPDDIDWADEVRIAIEERVAMSPDALTGMEANLRFNGPENMFTRVFGRLTAWQNWIFQRPNAVGEKGALKVYGKGDKAAFDWNRVERTSGGGCGVTPTRMSTINYSEKIQHQLQREDPQQRQPQRGPHAAARARAVAAQLPELVERHGPRRQPELRRLPAHRRQRRPAGLGAVRPREDARLPLGHLPEPGREGPQDPLRRPQGRSRLAGRARRIPRQPAPHHRHAGRHRAGSRSSSSATWA
jgi:benzoyl-CoA-dihydrodiol lyase